MVLLVKGEAGMGGWLLGWVVGAVGEGRGGVAEVGLGEGVAGVGLGVDGWCRFVGLELTWCSKTQCGE